jgi:CheY-like chemotaxis protein
VIRPPVDANLAAPTPATAPGAGPGHILRAEDKPADLRLVREALAEGEVPAQWHLAPSGQGGLRILHRADEHAHRPTPDLALLDLNLPGLHALEVLAGF